MTEHAPPSDHCLNCGHAFGADRLKYCPACGQETNVRPPTLGEFAQQFGGSYMAAEGALWRTLKLLFLRPGQLTREYLAGRRRRYLLPLRLYLTISLLALFAMRLNTALVVESKPDSAMVVVDPSDVNLRLELGLGRAGLHDGKFFCENLPGWLCRRLERRLDLDPKNVRREAEQASERFVGNLGAAMFVLVPAFALWLKLAYRARRMRYTEHLVFALHLHSFWFAALLLTQLPLPLLEDIGLLALPVYAVLASQRVYGGRWWATLLRNAAIAVAYGLTLAVAMGLLGLWTLIG